MKQFDKFISEARTTRASAQARRLGLVGDGHGDWYDKQGTLKAKTVRGELKMYDALQAQKDADAEDKALADRESSSGKSTAKDSEPRSAESKLGVDVDALLRQVDQFRARQQFDQAARREPLTIAFDKFDDEEVGANILAAVEESSGGQPYFVFPSRDADIEGLKTAYPEISESIVDDENAETIYDVLQSIYESGYNAINIVVRKSRAQEISKMAIEQNGNLYNYVMMNIIPVDERSIREQYIAGDIFKEGQFVETRKSSGTIIRRGANHVICLDESGKTFRSWINEVKIDLDIICIK